MEVLNGDIMEGIKNTGWSKIKEGTGNYANGHGRIICRTCEKWITGKPEPNCPKEHFIVYENQLKWRDSDRVNTLLRYGDKCSCVPCGYNDFKKKILQGSRHVRFLRLDHINGGGHQHMKQIHSIFAWVKRNKYPLGFRVLCSACNASMEPNDTICEYHKWLNSK